jgi:N-ethylmaleimide reductase
LLIEVAAAVADEIGAGRTGIRPSPVSPASGIVPAADEQPQFNHVVEALDALGIAYIHVVEGATGGPRDATPFDYDVLRQRFRNAYIANPDLVERLKAGIPLAQMDMTTLYGGGARGYTDYPASTAFADA